MATEVSDQLTEDSLLRGRLPLLQPRRGYRTNVDALWLADFAAGKRARRVLDLGCGVGAVGLVLACVDRAERVTLVDVDPELVAIAARNAERAAVADRVETRVVDVAQRLPKELSSAFDLVVANPPYGGEQRSPDERRARARSGDDDVLVQFTRAARAALGAAGRACFVYPTASLSTLLSALSTVGLEPKRLRMVHPLPDAAAKVALVEAKPARAGGLRVEPPLIAMTAPGGWSDEARAIIEGTRFVAR